MDFNHRASQVTLAHLWALIASEFGLGLLLQKLNRVATAGLRVGIVGWPTGRLFRILLLAPLRAPVLEPNLRWCLVVEASSR